MNAALSLAAPLEQTAPAPRFYLWAGKDKQSGPYTHEEMLALFEGGPPDTGPIVDLTEGQQRVAAALLPHARTALQLANDIDRDRSTICGHLRRLHQLRIVEAERRGKAHLWSLTPRGRQALEQLAPGAP